MCISFNVWATDMFVVPSSAGLSDVLCLNAAHLVSSSGHSVSIALLASTLRQMDCTLEGGQEAGY